MYNRLHTALCAAMVTLAAGLSACGSSAAIDASPDVSFGGSSGASGSQPAYTDSWQGEPATVSNPAALPPEVNACTQSSDPSCDIHRLDVPAGVRQVLVSIKPDQDSATDESVASTNDYDLYVYDDKNHLVGHYGDGDGDESLVFDTNGSSYYEVRVAAFTVAPGSTYHGVASAVMNRGVDDGADCDEFVPATAGFSGVTDDGQTIELSVHLLLDGTNEAVARSVIAKAAEAYAPLNIALTLHGIDTIQGTATDSQGIVDEGKAYFGGVPPAGADVVVVFTNKEMQAGDATGSTTVIGQADCIGGIRFPHHRFAAVTDVTSEEGDAIAPGFNLNVDMGSETMAHEIGHLMGAHHHYGNCVEGNLSSASDDDVSPCTLMFPAVNGASMNFGTFEGLVVRGHAVDYAGP